MPRAGQAVEVEGARQLRRDLKRAGAELADLRAAHAAVAAYVAARSLPAAPHKTGRLAASVRPGAQQGAALVRAGRASVPYAGPIHWGWAARNIAPQPWLWDTVQAEQDPIVTRYEAAIQALLEKVGGR